MFTGTQFYMMDGKGRLVIPANLRRQLGQSFVVTCAPEGCILALPTRQWVRLARTAAREFFVSGAVHVQVEPTTGRIMVPHALREWAGLMKGTEVAVAGIGAAVCLCPRERWDARMRYQETRILKSLSGPAYEDVRTYSPVALR